MIQDGVKKIDECGETISVEGIEDLKIRVGVEEGDWWSFFHADGHSAVIRDGYPTREAAIVGAGKAAKGWLENGLNNAEDNIVIQDLAKDIIAIDNFVANFDQSNNDVQVADEDEECADPVKMAAALKRLREELREAELVAYDAQKAAKAAKANVEALHERVKEVIDSFYPRKEHHPLWDKQEGEITQPNLPLEEEKWKSRDIAELQEYGVSKAVILKLREQEIKTFGKLEDHRVLYPNMSGIAGVGSVNSEKLLNGLLEWLDKNRDAAVIAEVKGGE